MSKYYVYIPSVGAGVGSAVGAGVGSSVGAGVGSISTLTQNKTTQTQSYITLIN